MENSPLPKSYDDWHRSVNTADIASAPILAPWNRDALSLAPPLGTASVLEVGCGSGDFAMHLSAISGSVAAVDFSPAAIEIAQRRQVARGTTVGFRVADAQALPFGDGEFDVVFSCECLEHLPDPQRGLEEMTRVLKPSGTLVLTTENYSNAMLTYWLMAWVCRKPFNSGTVAQPIEQFFLFWRVRRMMRRAGLGVSRMIGAHHVFLVIPGTHPHLFVKERIRTPLFAWLLRPMARHMTFKCLKPR